MSKARKPEAGLNAKQERFCLEYMVDLNATQAAVRAGYSAKSARMIGPENLSKPAITARITQLSQQVAQETGITIERTVREIAARAYPRMSAFFVQDTDGTWRLDTTKAKQADLDGIGSFDQDEMMVGDANEGFPILKQRFRLVDQARYLDMLMKHLGGYAPVKIAQTDTQGNDVDPTLELRARLAAVVQRLPRGGAIEPGPADSGVGA